jgi:hypothetical protein
MEWTRRLGSAQATKVTANNFGWNYRAGTCAAASFGGWRPNRYRRAPEKVIRGPLDTTCDMASPRGGVMLRLRFCYVSKAAILTIPVRHVPVENRSPA